MQDTPIERTDALVVECHVRAKASEVFSGLTIPDRLLRWWGDRSKWWLTSADVDLRPGGRFWVLWENTKGETDGMGGHFKVIKSNQGFVLSFVGSHAKSYVEPRYFRRVKGECARSVIRTRGQKARDELSTTLV